MKQKNKFNKCIKRAIKAAYSEREEMQKQRDIWERAINEKDRQIDTLNGMLEVQPLETLKEEKPFDEVWADFLKTCNYYAKEYKATVTAFYNGLTLNVRHLENKEDVTLNAFLRHVGIRKALIDGEPTDLDTSGIYVKTLNGEIVMCRNGEFNTIQRILP